MATESCVTHAPAQFLYRETRNIWVIEENANSFLELKLQPKTFDGGTSKETPTCQEPNQSSDETISILPAISDVKNSLISSKTSFNILSEGFYNDNKDVCLGTGSGNLTKENTLGSNGMSSSLKSDDETDTRKQEAPLKPHSKKSKKKANKSRKRSKPSLGLKCSETEQDSSHHPKSANGASKLRVRSKTENVHSGLAELTAQCKAVKIHQSNEPKTKRNPENDSSERRHIFQPYYDPRPPITSGTRCANSHHKGDNSSNSSLVSLPSPIRLTQRSLTQAEKVYLQQVKKVYLSEKHSGVIRDEGREFPCAPPATPTPEQLKKFEYIPSLNDVRSQRAVREKLQAMERRKNLQNDRRREEHARLEKIQQRDRQMELRRRQRQEIYALNQIMTDLEHQRFLEFCHSKGINS